MNQKDQAEALAGKYVRFRHLPAKIKPTPVLVTKVLSNGMIRLFGWSGDFAPHLFVVVDPPAKKKRSRT